MKQDIKRINVGGANVYDVMYKNLNLKYPTFKTKLSQSCIQAVMETMSFAATDYSEQLRYFQHGAQIFDNSAYRGHIQHENNSFSKKEAPKTLLEPRILEFSVEQQPVPSIVLVSLLRLLSLASYQRGSPEEKGDEERAGTKTEGEHGKEEGRKRTPAKGRSRRA